MILKESREKKVNPKPLRINTDNAFVVDVLKLIAVVIMLLLLLLLLLFMLRKMLIKLERIQKNPKEYELFEIVSLKEISP